MYQTSILRRKWSELYSNLLILLRLRPEDVDILRNLERKIEELMHEHFRGNSASCFGLTELRENCVYAPMRQKPQRRRSFES